MTDDSILTRLESHRTLGKVPRAELEWVARHGRLRVLECGEVLMGAGEVSQQLAVVLTGLMQITVDRGAGPHVLYEFGAGGVSGALPFSRGAKAPAPVLAAERTEIFEVPIADLPEMIRECPHVTAACVHAMLDRARVFSTNDLRDEKLVSLGRLAAGLAHELNNPSSAAVRSARLLDDALRRIESASASVGAANLSGEQRGVIERVRGRCFARLSGPLLAPVARADREESIATWLADHGASEECAGPLAETALSLSALDELAAAVDGEALDASLRWIAAGCTVRSLAIEIQMATKRIHDLVGSVKGFTYMDQARVSEPVDIRVGIADTFTLLNSKTRTRGVAVAIELPDDLPRVQVVGAELNQVWMNIIDNALDAVPEGGHVTVRGAVEKGRVAVRISDDGPGIKPETLGRIFDPFFTTKDVGKGTGLGLDITRRILHRLEGEITVESEPGHTEFRVTLPMAK